MTTKPLKLKPVKQRTMAENIARLVAEFGAEVNVSIHSINPDACTPKSRRQVNKSLINTFPEQDIYAYDFSDDIPWLTVVWDYAMPPQSPSRVTLGRCLQEAGGLRSANISHLWCVPYALGQPPLAQEIARYRLWLLKAVLAAGSKYVLLVGSRPMWVWRPEMKMRDVGGKIFIWQSRYVTMPCDNPLAVSAQKYPYKVWREQLARFVGAIRSDYDTEVLELLCVHNDCLNPVYWYDSDGVPWCRKHHEEGMTEQEKGVKLWRTETIDAGRVELFPNTNS